MASDTPQRSPATILLPVAALVFGVLAFTSSLLYLAGTIACLAAITMERPGKRGLGIAMLVIAAAYFFAVFSYGIGKDLAKRDNAVSAAKLK